MTADRWHRVLELYHQALGYDEEQRAAFLDSACGDADMRRQVDALLAKDTPDAFLAMPALEAIASDSTGYAHRLASGDTIGSFHVLSPLGVGGMGEVYHAHDTALKRDVALKVLPSSLVEDGDRLLRFEREAQVLAALNHPNIGAIYGFEKASGVPALVLELVEGPTLADRIAGSPIPLEDALSIAVQVARALEAAHEHGIIHRDLKPANIKLRPDGVVKVLDFGLAKMIGPSGDESTGISSSPNITATSPGMILGTAAYMSPEQARGRAVDRRSDTWAFGCVLFEMLAGRPAFTGEAISDTIAAILSSDPDWQALPPDATDVRPLLARCLKKDPQQRLQAIGDARVEIEELREGTSFRTPAPRRTSSKRSLRLASMAAVALVTGAVVSVLTWMLTGPASEIDTPPWRFELATTSTQSLIMNETGRVVAISPDGRSVAYVARVNGMRQLLVRAIDSLDARQITGIATAREPLFSPGSRWIAFFDGVNLKKAPVSGGPAVTIAENSSYVSRGASWGDDNSIVFAAQDGGGLKRVSASGGDPATLTTPDAGKGEANHWFPSALPGGRGVLFTINGAEGLTRPQVAVLDLQTGKYRPLLRGSQAEYIPSGHLVYVEAGTLYAVRFDLARLEVRGEPAAVVDSTLQVPSTGAGNYAISREGTLIYVPAVAQQRSLVWVDRAGQQTPLRAPLRAYDRPRLSPDGNRVALAIHDQEDDIWIWDLARESLVRLTSGPSIDSTPIWSPDGRKIVFGSRRDGPEQNLFVQAADGTGNVERLTTSPHFQGPGFVAPDGTTLIGSDVGPRTGSDIMRFPFGGTPSRSTSTMSPGVEPLVQSPLGEADAAISPDGRFMAYVSGLAAAPSDIYVRPYPRVNDGWWQISTGGGAHPVWSRDGRELFYIDAANTLMAVPVRTSGPTFAWEKPMKLFNIAPGSTGGALPDYDVARDGRFLMIRDQAEGLDASRPRMIVSLEFFEDVKRRVP